MGEDTVSVVNIGSMKEEKRIKVGAAPVTTGVTSDGETLVATLNGENALAVVDLATEKVDKIPVGTGPHKSILMKMISLPMLQTKEQKKLLPALLQS